MNYNIVQKLKTLNKNILILVMIIICFITQTIYIKAEENKVIKVGYPIVEGFTELEDGTYSGYAYEYLREIAKYTGWEYEFVEMDLNEAMYALKDGNIDLLAGMMKNDQSIELYDFPEYDIGSTYTTLSTLKDNKNISQSNYETLEGIKVGYFETSKVRLQNFIDFYERNNINNIELVPYPYEEGSSLIDKLKAKEVDAIIGGDLLVNEEEKVIAKFGAIPYYLATTKGNEEIISGLNSAISKIKERNSDFNQELYNKYFLSNNDYSFSLTTKEKEYIKNSGKLKAVYIEDYNPLQYYNKKSKEAKGVFIDFINIVSEKTGLDFELIKVGTYDEAYEIVKNGKADLIVGVPSNFLIADRNNITLTASYLDLDMVKVVRKGEQLKEKWDIVALPKGYGYADIDYAKKIEIYDSIEECIEAVSNGEVDVAYGNSYTITHYIAGSYYPNLSIISEGKTVPASVGISKSIDKNLLTIINKVIYSIPDDEIQDIVYNNTMDIEHDITVKKFFFQNLGLCILIIIGILTIISTMISIIVKLRFDKIKTSREILFRKTQIDSLTGIYNREACERFVTEYLNTKNKSLYGVFIIIDIDNFKQVNDNLGHKVGDKVLSEFAGVLKQLFSHIDILSRLGGDEFIIFMKDIDENNLYKIDEKLKELCKIMNKKVEYNGNSQNISLSIGAVITKNNLEFEELYQMADEKLYTVKRSGKNGFRMKIYE